MIPVLLAGAGVGAGLWLIWRASTARPSLGDLAAAMAGEGRPVTATALPATEVLEARLVRRFIAALAGVGLDPNRRAADLQVTGRTVEQFTLLKLATALGGVLFATVIVGLLFASDLLGRPFGSGSPYTAEAATAVELCCLLEQQGRGVHVDHQLRGEDRREVAVLLGADGELHERVVSIGLEIDDSQIGEAH